MDGDSPPSQEVGPAPDSCEERVRVLEASLSDAKAKIDDQNTQIQDLTRALSQAQARSADSLAKLAQRIEEIVERDEKIAGLEKEILASKEEAFSLKRRLEDAVRAQKEYQRGLQQMTELCESYRQKVENFQQVDISRADKKVLELEQKVLSINRDTILMRYLEELETLRSRLRDSSVLISEMRERQKSLESELEASTANPRSSRLSHRSSLKGSLDVTTRKGYPRSAPAFGLKERATMAEGSGRLLPGSSVCGTPAPDASAEFRAPEAGSPR